MWRMRWRFVITESKLKQEQKAIPGKYKLKIRIWRFTQHAENWYRFKTFTFSHQQIKRGKGQNCNAFGGYQLIHNCKRCLSWSAARETLISTRFWGEYKITLLSFECPKICICRASIYHQIFLKKFHFSHITFLKWTVCWGQSNWQKTFFLRIQV